MLSTDMALIRLPGVLLLYFSLGTTVYTTDSDPPGHMKPLGQHRPPIGGIEEASEFPEPKRFYEEYIRGSKPVLFRGILEKGFLPAYKLWSDDYLRKEYGKDTVTVELGKKEVREAGGDSFTLNRFLDSYQERNIYMVNDVSENMARDVILPRSLACGGFQRSIQHVIMWFSSGGTKSVLHNDGLDNINCLIDGEKYFVMIDKKQSKLIETEHWMKNGSYHRVDVERVDMYKYPQFQDVTWHEVIMKKGDCLFIPFKWYHHVDSSATKGRNMALNFWFSHMYEFNDTDCKNTNIDDPVPFSGVRKPKPDLESIRAELMIVFDDNDVVDKDFFIDNVAGSEVLDPETAETFYIFIDKNKDQKISREEMLTFDFEKAMKEIPALKSALDSYLGEEEGEEGMEEEIQDEGLQPEAEIRDVERNMDSTVHEEL